MRRVMPPCDSGMRMARSCSTDGVSSNIWTSAWARAWTSSEAPMARAMRDVRVVGRMVFSIAGGRTLRPGAGRRCELLHTRTRLSDGTVGECKTAPPVYAAGRRYSGCRGDARSGGGEADGADGARRALDPGRVGAARTSAGGARLAAGRHRPAVREPELPLLRAGAATQRSHRHHRHHRGYVGPSALPLAARPRRARPAHRYAGQAG